MNKFNISLVLGVLTVLLLLSFNASLVIIASFVSLVLCFWFVMAICMRCNFFVKSINRSAGSNVVLSFDDGPHPEITPKILDILKKHKVQALFFVVGKNIDGNEKIIERIIAEGHGLGSHSFNHPNTMGFLSLSKVKAEIKKGHDELSKFLTKPGILFRPPVGVTNPNIAKAIVQLGLQSVGWSLRSFDTVSSKKEQILIRVLRKVNQGDIVLLHDSKENTLAILEDLIVALKEQKLVLTAKLD